MVTNNIEYTRQYYEKNKERIKQLMGQKIICTHCGIEIVKSHLNRHLKSKKCQNYKF